MWTVASAAAVAVLAALVSPGSARENPAPARANPCDRFAAPDGNDRNRGTLRSPFATPNRLIRSLRPGQTGCLRHGSYAADDEPVLAIDRGGRPGEPIRIRSFPGERARLVGIVHLRAGADHVVLSRLTIEGVGDQNTIKIYAADVVIERNDITNAWRGQSCMMLGSNDGPGGAVRTIVRGNRFHECGDPDNDNKDHSIYAANLSGGKIVDNLFWNHTGRAIQLYPNADRNLVAHNVIDGGSPSVRGGVVIGSDGGDTSSGNVIEHNIIAYSTEWNLYTNWNDDKGSDNVARRNCFWAGGAGNIETDDGGLTAHDNMIANPQLRSRAQRDYRLHPASKCLKVVGYDTAARLRR